MNEKYDNFGTYSNPQVVLDPGRTDVSALEKKKKNLKAEVAAYDKSYSNRKYWITFILSVIATVLFGVVYQLDWYLLIAVGIVGAMIAPRIMRDVSRNKYEEQKFLDTTSYVEQMLYSFRRNSKIIASLNDTLMVFQDGDMKDAIQEAIDYIQTAESSGNIYEEALMIIEEKYKCRRIKSLHRYLIKVEGAGGDHNMGVSALITDRSLWIDRVEDFKKEKKSVMTNILVATIFSSIVCGLTMYMLPQDAGAAKHIACMAYSAIYICVNLLNVKAAVHRLTLLLNDMDDLEHEQFILNKLHKFQNYDIKEERKQAIKPAALILVLGAVAVLITDKLAILIPCILMAAFAYFVQPPLRYRSTKKLLITEIEKVYPDWLLELSLLLQTDNLHVALEKTLPDAPLFLREELTILADKIVLYPNDIEPYAQFFDYLPVPNIHSSMKLLYSISEFGSDEEEKQIEELIERNSVLMNKAEQHKNMSKLSSVFMLQFVPMGTSALKLIVDMGVFIVVFIGKTMQQIN